MLANPATKPDVTEILKMFRKAKRRYGNPGHPSVSLFVRPSVRPRYVVSALKNLFVDQLISILHTSIIVVISSLSSKLGKIVRMMSIFKMSAKTHQNFKVLQFQRKLIFRRFLFLLF